jgi:hypothetical protein
MMSLEGKEEERQREFAEVGRKVREQLMGKKKGGGSSPGKVVSFGKEGGEKEGSSKEQDVKKDDPAKPSTALSSEGDKKEEVEKPSAWAVKKKVKPTVNPDGSPVRVPIPRKHIPFQSDKNEKEIMKWLYSRIT